MIEAFEDVSRSCAIEVPASHRLGIALIGAGAIMSGAHVPAYLAADLPIVGVFDVSPDSAQALADRIGNVHVYRSLDELFDDDRCQVVDVAVPAVAQPAIVAQALERGRHVLAQKPFAPSAAAAQQLADLGDEQDLLVAVNQQLRFDEGMAAAHRMVELGWIGEPTFMSIDVDIWTDWSQWPWMLTTDRLELLVHSIHYHDVMRWFLGEPETVFCAAGHTPGQTPAGETRTISTALYEGGARSVVHANHENASGDNRATFRIDGERGSIKGTLGLLYDYPSGRPDTLEVRSDVLPTDGWLPYPVTTRWIPDAFLGPMASLLGAVAEGTTLRSSARDNVGTLKVIEALYASIDSGQSVRLSSS